MCSTRIDYVSLTLVVYYLAVVVIHDRYNNIEIKYHYIWDMMKRIFVELQYISTDEQIEDILTKPLSRV
jgi:hypothetical protein